MMRIGCGKLGFISCDGSVRSIRTQNTRGKPTSKRCFASWRETPKRFMKFVKELVEGSEKRCVSGAFGSTRVSRESNCRESVLDTS